jgi:phage terminase small subunit
MPEILEAEKTPRATFLEDQLARFVAEYVKDLNGKRAAQAIGIGPANAASWSRRKLALPEVQDMVADAQQDAAKAAKVEATTVLRGLLAIAEFDPAALVDEHGALLPLHQMPREARRAIQKIEVEELFAGAGKEREHVGQLKKVTFADRRAALVDLGKHLALFVERVDVSGDALVERILAGRKQASQ